MAMLDKMKDSINAAGQGISTKIKDGLESERISAKIRDENYLLRSVDCVHRLRKKKKNCVWPQK